MLPGMVLVPPKPPEHVCVPTGFPPAPLLAGPEALLGATLTTGSTVEARLGECGLAMSRIVVPSDGNCLFASVNFLVAGEHTAAGAAAQSCGAEAQRSRERDGPHADATVAS